MFVRSVVGYRCIGDITSAERASVKFRMDAGFPSRRATVRQFVHREDSQCILRAIDELQLANDAVEAMMDWTLKIGDLAIVFATFFGPIAALWIQRIVEERRDQRRRRLDIYRRLMIERGANSPAFVWALNAIPIEFNESTGQVGDVREAWKIYLNHMGKDVNEAGWNMERIRLLVDLLQAMGKHLGYDVSRVEIETGIYAPVGHAQAASDQDAIRAGVAALLRGEKTLPLEVKSMPADPEMVALWRTALEGLGTYFGQNKPPAN